jgi:hypothetical protein
MRFSAADFPNPVGMPVDFFQKSDQSGIYACFFKDLRVACGLLYQGH